MEERAPKTTATYNKILEHEQRMDSLRFDLIASIRAGDHSRTLWLECRHHLRQLHEELVRTDVPFVQRGGLLYKLWMRLYYGVVERVREMMGKLDEHEEDVHIDILSILD